MSLDDYLATKRRNRAKKELKRKYPGLMGQRLEDAVDRHLGIVDSGKMDWAMLKDNSKTSKYPTPDSIKYENFVEVGEKYRVRPYILYWFYQKKLSKLKARGSEKNNYLEFLKDIASASVGKELSDDTKMVAVGMFAKDLKGVTLKRPQIESMILEGKI